MTAPDTAVAGKLSTLDRFLPVWIGAAMVAGLLLGRVVPGLGDTLAAVELDGISLPIALGLLIMMYPVLAKVRYDRLDSVTGDRRLLLGSLALNWISAPICCAPVSAAPLDDDTALRDRLRLKALADPVRIKLVSILLADAGDGICTCDLATAVGLTEATTSHHLGQLRKAGMVTADRRGMNVYYRAQPDSLDALRNVLGATTGCC